MLNTFTLASLLAQLFLAALSSEDTCPKVSDSSQVTGKCAQNKCDVTIGGNPYCSQCSEPSDHLVDGKCVAASGDTNNNCVNTNNQGTCTQCDGQSFMYQGGCYQTGASNPGILSALLHQMANALQPQRGTSSPQEQLQTNNPL